MKYNDIGVRGVKVEFSSSQDTRRPIHISSVKHNRLLQCVPSAVCPHRSRVQQGPGEGLVH